MAGFGKKSVEQQVMEAKENDAKFTRLVEENKDFILKTAGNACKHYVDTSSDEWSIALSAFYEAVCSYEESKGNFFLFAQLVIKRRITDFIRKQYRGRMEISVSPDVFSGSAEEDESVDQAIQAQIMNEVVIEPQNDIALEIEAIGTILGGYGFDFMDLTECSPKAGKTKKSCAESIRLMIAHPELLERLRETKTLPIKILEKEYGQHRKILERHRKYIIAAIEILTGDYPFLAEYLKSITEDDRSE